MQDDPSSDLCRMTLMLMMLLTLWLMEDDPYAGVIYAIDGADSCDNVGRPKLLMLLTT